MKHALAAAFLLCVGLYSAPASAASKPNVVNVSFVIANHRKTLMLYPSYGGVVLKNAPSGEGWFKSKHSLSAWYMSPRGSPLVRDNTTLIPDTSYMVAAAGDLTGGGTNYMKYDSLSSLYVNMEGATFDGSGNLNVNINGAGAGGVVLGASNAQIGRLNQIVPFQSGAALQAGCSGTPACTFESNSGGSNTTLFYIAYYGTSMTGTSTITCWDTAAATPSGSIVLFTANMGNTQIVTYGPNGRQLTSGHVSCTTAGAVLGASMNIEIGLI